MVRRCAGALGLRYYAIVFRHSDIVVFRMRRVWTWREVVYQGPESMVLPRQRNYETLASMNSGQRMCVNVRVSNGPVVVTDSVPIGHGVDPDVS